ncbi:HEAT repeat domain-containing protein [Pseudoalteromonas luteoviolacea]|uniref:HEAT repeat domain-containing protein n=1 Tax=Pseudoalteromonas luteoviolacea TaxID=43657 RepID=UPI001B361A89|nr:HEAT repeat domain-containing protein [Pseudoalteromonas luteoviolacea]MBQ4810261.1 HEAT repeat domain-containing protein [Pseudoalteromonas luteoviolacea]
MRWIMWVGLFCAMSMTMSHVASAARCKDIEQCISQIPYKHENVRGKGSVDKAIREQLLAHGRKALEPLARVAKESNPNRQAVADSLIAQIQGLQEEDFEIIQSVIKHNRSYERGGVWSYRALGYIGGEKAGTFLVDELKRVQTASNQIGVALMRLGAGGIPFLIEGLRCFEPCHEDEEAFDGIGEVFYKLGNELSIVDAESAKQLIKLIQDDKVTDAAKHVAMSAIGDITQDPQIAQWVYDYAIAHPKFVDSATESLQTMKSPLVEYFYSAQLRKEIEAGFPSSVYQLPFTDLARLGKVSEKTGSQIVAFLQAPSWEVRVEAALSLGYIGYHQGISDLITLVENPHDWRQSYAGIKALHLLSAKSALPAIDDVAQTHWYAPLRQYAHEVVTAFKQETPLSAFYQEQDRSEDLFKLMALAQVPPICHTHFFEKVPESIEVKQYATKAQPLTAFSYPEPVCAYEAEYCEVPRNITPAFAAKFQGRWLVGDSRGEFGGELMSFVKSDKTKIILKENIEDVYVIGDYAYAVTGLAHGFSNLGMIFKIQMTKQGYVVAPFYRLPGAPNASWKLNDGAIFIKVGEGAVIFHPETGLKMADCDEQSVQLQQARKEDIKNR